MFHSQILINSLHAAQVAEVKIAVTGMAGRSSALEREVQVLRARLLHYKDTETTLASLQVVLAGLRRDHVRFENKLKAIQSRLDGPENEIII